MSCRDCDPNNVCPECGQHKEHAPVPPSERVYGGFMPHPQCYFPHTTGLPMKWLGEDYRLYGIDPETGWVVDLERQADAKLLMKK
jgi:hypothetical protein